MKAGIKTSEFWVTLSVVVAALITLLKDLIEVGAIASTSKWVIVAGAALAGIYTLARALVKQGEAKSLKLLVPLLGCLLLIGCTTTNPVDPLLAANTLRHDNAVNVIGGMRQLVEASAGAPEVKAEMLAKLRQAEGTEIALHTAMEAYLRLEKGAVDQLMQLVEKIKEGFDDE